ncbi:Succinyl-CoA:(R)-benzylsuccinate CoA-transferase subunit BbsE [Georgfuchsia toluolica]|uniref:Succinyl-CoA:(R)-benzylsuccinate CoA-transferase subunit BbsE n=1 Tax=Georgfuchsia toluolica TaxID=424218 RepID=A0A916J8G1_9PROT|nr:CoA transferase [Georgfuchsia toluolica]CAG4885405.1 Succinyl-CoA:(R)-benzylsuccinate CoA-transferase subunit BbsE [Georgfuchsia toluolica]
MEQSYFSKLKILDFTGELGPYTAKMFAGIGAEVIHLEPLGGDPLRQSGPFYKNAKSQESSLPFCYFNSGKRGLALDLKHAAGKKIFRQLCTDADLLIESFVPGYLQQQGLSYEELSANNPKLVQTSITPFGHSGPLSQQAGSDLICSAMSGFLYLAGVGHEKPVRSPDNQAYRMAEAYAAVGSAIALFNAKRTGKGQFVDVACIEAGAGALENAAQFWDLEGKIRRGRGREAGSATLHPCADGYVAIVAIMGKNKVMWDPFVEWMKQEGVEEWSVFDDDKWIESAYRESAEGYNTFCRIFEKYTLKHDKRYLYETGQRFSVAITPVSNGKDLLENPQLDYRGFWQRVHNDTLDGDVVYPGAPYEFGEIKWRLGRNAPRLGEHTGEILREHGYSNEDISALVKAGAVYAE